MAVVLGSAGALGGGATYALTADAVSGPPKDGDQKDGDQKDGVHSGSAGDTSDASSSGSSGGGGSSASERGDNAARDMTILLTLGGNLPGIIVPSLCGSLVTDFSSRAEGYRLFWVLLHIHLEPFSLSKTQHLFTRRGTSTGNSTSAAKRGIDTAVSRLFFLCLKKVLTGNGGIIKTNH